jgi:hypothetical protein
MIVNKQQQQDADPRLYEGRQNDTEHIFRICDFCLSISLGMSSRGHVEFDFIKLAPFLQKVLIETRISVRNSRTAMMFEHVVLE